MTKQRREEAIKYIEAQLEDGYIDLGLHDQDELEIIKEAIELLKEVWHMRVIKADIDAIIFPQTIGSVTYYSSAELIEWVEKQQVLNKEWIESYQRLQDDVEYILNT